MLDFRCLACAVLVVAATVAPATASAPPTVALSISASDGRGHRFAAEVSCRGDRASATGYLRLRAPAACRHARRIAGFLGSIRPTTQPCTEIYGGPDTARIRGRIGAAVIDRALARGDGCAIADWTTAGLLVPRSRFRG